METTGIPITLLFTIIGTLIMGLIVMLIGKINSNEKACAEKIKAILKEIADLNECEKKNYSFRHNFDTVTRGLMQHFETRMDNIEKIIEDKFTILIKVIGKDKCE